MNTLFPIEPVLPEGFLYTPNFIDDNEETLLLEEIRKLELHNFVFHGFTANRKIASFGYDYSFSDGSLNKGEDIPPAFDFLIQKVSKHISIPQQKFAELLVIEYPIGCVMNWHRDAPPFGLIAGISLLSDCTFKLRPHEKEKQTRSATILVPLQRRSLYIMNGPSRTDWQHSVAAVKQVRYSITLRTLKK